MVEYITRFLIGITTLLGVQTAPGDDPFWKENSNWTRVDNHYEYSATSLSIPDKCKKSPDGYLRIPQIIHGVHELFLDGKIVFRSGDPTFKIASPFYERPEINCQILQNGLELKWKVFSYSKYFARFKTYPSVFARKSPARLFDVNLNMMASAALVLLCLFSYYLFSAKINKEIANGLALGAISFAVYFTMTASREFYFTFSMLTAHKIADVGTLLGAFLYFYVFHKFNYFPKTQLIVTGVILTLFSLVIIFSNTGDVIQFGTSLSLPAILFGLITVAHHALKETLKNKSDKQAWLSFTSTMLFVLTASNDTFHIFGLIDTYMVLPIGVVSGIFLLALSANQQIEKTYQERDDLLHTLENKVAEKTRDLTAALEDLKRSQADLVQSAKLASLGTLSAGVAHEINNSINFVNGAIVPLERKVMALIPENEKPSLQKLFAAMKHGTDMTVQIVRSLRSFTGLNQASFRDVSINEVVDSVLTILKSKLRDTEVTKEIQPELTLQASQVGLSQVLMNLISNAIDVLPKENGKIAVKSYRENENIFLEITDNGGGMSEEIKNRIFDPFFTTKDVGSGTGLGLFIVKKEVDRHQGKITVHSELNKGTTFKITFPINVSTEVLTENRRAA